MTEDKKQPKELPGLQKVVSKELIGNAIALTIVGLGSWGMTFHSTWGPAKGMGTYLGFIACMIPFFTVIQTLIPLINKRRELVHGKWELKEDEVQNPTEPLLNIWSAFLPRAFVLGFGSMLVVLALIKVSSWQPTPFLTTLIVIIVTIINTSLLLKRFMPSTLLSYAMALRNGEKQSPQPLAGYLTVEHIIPFILLQGYINACVSNRALHFELDKANVGYVPTEALLPDALILFVLLALFQWMFSNWVVRGDVHLGKVPTDKLKHISVWGALGYIFGAGIVVTALYWVVLYIGQVPGLSIGMAVLFKLSIMCLCVVLGAWIGVRWGGLRELANIKA